MSTMCTFFDGGELYPQVIHRHGRCGPERDIKACRDIGDGYSLNGKIDRHCLRKLLAHALPALLAARRSDRETPRCGERRKGNVQHDR